MTDEEDWKKTEVAIPMWLVKVNKRLEEQMSPEKLENWREHFFKAMISCGDLDKITAQFFTMLLTEALNNFNHSGNEYVKEGIEECLALWKHKLPWPEGKEKILDVTMKVGSTLYCHDIPARFAGQVAIHATDAYLCWVATEENNSDAYIAMDNAAYSWIVYSKENNLPYKNIFFFFSDRLLEILGGNKK